MKNSINLKFGDIELTVGSYKGVPINKWGGWCYKHKITIVRGDKKVNFNFFNSQIAYSKRQEYLTDRDMKDAFECIVDDAIVSYNYSNFIDFAENYGYDDYDEAKRVYYGCNRTFLKLNYVLDLEPDDLFDIANYLRNEYEEN